MGTESRQDQIDDGQVLNKTTFGTVAATLTAQQQVVEYTTAAGACACTLPPVIEAMGKIYTISLITDGGDLTVQDQDDSRDWTDLTMDTANDYCCLYSDGRKWFNLDSETA